MKNKVACCYLTHEHPEAMGEVLKNICKPYGEKGIDIYVYDSSETDETEKIVNSYIDQDLCRLYYVPVKFIKGIRGGDEKYLYVIKGNGLNGHYDYIWPTKDRIWFEGETLENICKAIDEDHDIIFSVDERDRYEIISKPFRNVYTDPVEFFDDYGALTTNWECLIRRTDTMLDPADWDMWATKYNVSKDNNFNQTVSTFVRLSEMDSCSIRVVRMGLGERMSSKRGGSNWSAFLMEIWIDRWIPTIFSLPNIYDAYKMNVVKTQLSHIALFGSNDAIVIMRNSGALTPERIKDLSSMWGMISRLPYENVERILAHDEQALCEEQYARFLESFRNGDYEGGYYLFIQNRWLETAFSEEEYRKLVLSYYVYLMDMRLQGHSALFDGVHDIKDLFANYDKFSGGR